MTKKKILIFGIYVIAFILLVTYTTIPNEYRVVTKNADFVMIVDADKRELFDLMADVENYPNILPDNYVSVFIKNRNNNSILTSEVVTEQGIQSTLNVKHTILPYDNHIIEILDGDAKDTKITTIFEEYGSKTKLMINVEIHARGILIPFAYLPKNNLNHAVNSVINGFLEKLNT